MRRIGLLLLLLTMVVTASIPSLVVAQGDDDTFETYGVGHRPLPDHYKEMVVEKVVDGDTVRLHYRNDGWWYPVRIVGIDTPEKNGPYTDAECYGTEASTGLAELLPEGTIVYVERDVTDQDRNGRWLRHIWLPYSVDDEDVEDEAYLVSEILVRGGFADARVYEPDDKYADLLSEAEKDARSDDAGMWGAC